MAVIGRRLMLLSGACAVAGRARVAAAALPVPLGGTLAFRLMRHGGEIGRHTTTFERAGDTLTVHTVVEALVTIISIPVVRYRNTVSETWQGDTLVALTAETDKNSQHEWLNARRSAEGLVVLGSKTQRYIAPEPARAATYWNRHMLDGPMISLEDGVLLRPKVEVVGHAEPIPVASGATIPADHYNLSGPFSVDLWYDQSNTWAGLQHTAPDGSVVHYERL